MQEKNTRKIIDTDLIFNGGATSRATTGRIVLHHTASGDVSAGAVHRWHLQRGFRGIGYHYLIRKDGTIERGRPEHIEGAHVAGANHDSIGVALAGNFETSPPTAAQIDAVVWLIRDIKTRHPGVVIVGHNEIAATACPGRFFPTEKIREWMKEGDVRLLINGRRASDVVLKIEGGRTFALLEGTPSQQHWIQVRALAGLLGAAISWDAATRTVSLEVL